MEDRSERTRAVEAYLHEHIPLSAALGARVLAADPSGVTLSAPLEPNLNHRQTGFGGSISALSILAGWTFLHVTVRPQVAGGNIVIQRSEIEFLRPVASSFEALCLPPDGPAWQGFLDSLTRKRRGRIRLGVRVVAAGELVALFRGQYVVVA